jgi:hypothetical protein
MTSKFPLAILLLALVPCHVSAEQYYLGVEYIEAQYDAQSSLEEVLQTLTVVPVEVVALSDQPFAATAVAGERKLSLAGTILPLPDGKVRLEDFSLQCQGQSLTTELECEPSTVICVGGVLSERISTEGKRRTERHMFLAMIWRLPIDEPSLARKRAALNEARQAFVRNEIMAKRRQAAAKHRAGASLLALAQKHLAEGEPLVAQHLLSTFSFHGTPLEKQASDLSARLQAQSGDANPTLIKLP